MNRRERRRKRAPRSSVVLNIVSLIDIFAILVFYLLVDSLVVEPIELPPQLKLPAAAVESMPAPGLTLVVGTTQVLLDAHLVQGTEQLRSGDSAALRAALAQARREGRSGEIRILADRRIPYRLLREVMNACSEGATAQVSLAVLDRLPGSGA
ncbi:MAG TPA: biopolymer transporter ExbD [Solimonas sp.]|nr:biopolymer transporter ExbD [Solimonas sp.]